MKLENSDGRTTIAKNKQEDVLAVQKLPRVCQKEEKKGLTDYLKIELALILLILHL